jgi:hypothetical protein
LWLIEHHPESEILHSYVSHFAPGELSPADYKRAVSLWGVATKSRSTAAAVQWNAATFFEGLDSERHMRLLEATAAADPNHPFALRPLAHLYALSLLERGHLAAHAEAGLEASRNVWVLGNAAYMLQSQYNLSVQQRRRNPRAAELAERYFQRAHALNPNLDRRTILPQIDLKANASQQESRQQWLARAEEALRNIRRLPIDAFPDLPGPVANVLRARRCTVPQPWGDNSPRNVIRGEFLFKGETGWAVLCSVNATTALLVFRNNSDTAPQTINSTEDRGYLQGVDAVNMGYSRQISVATREFITRHYRAYGGPQPPPIDHHGIDVAFLEKASVTWYWHQNRWLPLQGAD